MIVAKFSERNEIIKYWNSRLIRSFVIESVGTYAGCSVNLSTKLVTPQNHWVFSDSEGVLVEIYFFLYPYIHSEMKVFKSTKLPSQFSIVFIRLAMK